MIGARPLSMMMGWLSGKRAPQPAPPTASPDLRTARIGRLWQLGQTTAALGHDFGQPLNIIRLTAEAALDALDHNRADPDRIRRSLNAAVDQTRRMQAMIDALLAGTRRPVDPPEPLRPAAVVRRALSAVLPRLRAQSIRLIWHADLATPAVSGHARRLELAVTNLLLNAADALAAYALAGDKPEPGVLRVSCQGGSNGAVIVVEDNGPGLPSALRASLDTPFPNLGLGLTVSLGVVAEMGGSIGFDALSPGTRVTIHLPHCSRSVLVVDEAEAARKLGDCLAGQGWQVQTAKSGVAARQLIGQTPCDVVITGLGGEGWGLIEELHTRTPDLIIVALTSTQDADARRAVAAGAVLVLDKAISPQQIALELGDLVGNAF